MGPFILFLILVAPFLLLLIGYRLIKKKMAKRKAIFGYICAGLASVIYVFLFFKGISGLTSS